MRFLNSLHLLKKVFPSSPSRAIEEERRAMEERRKREREEWETRQKEARRADWEVQAASMAAQRELKAVTAQLLRRRSKHR